MYNHSLYSLVQQPQNKPSSFHVTLFYTWYQRWCLFMFLLQRLQENICLFMKNQLKRLQRALGPDCSEYTYLESHYADEGMMYNVDDEQRRRCRKAFLKITVHFLRRMNLNDLANSLKNSKTPFIHFSLTLPQKHSCAHCKSMQFPI